MLRGDARLLPLIIAVAVLLDSSRGCASAKGDQALEIDLYWSKSTRDVVDAS